MKLTILRFSALLMFIFAYIFANADDIKTVEGTYTIIGDERTTLLEAKRQAAENARIEALRDEFGTIVSQDVMSAAVANGAEERSHFMELSSSEVKGEWLGDVGEPKYEVSMSQEGFPVVKCTVKGRARALSNRGHDFEATLLRNGSTKQFADTHFREKDDLYLHFSAPVSGYVQVYLADESGDVYSMLPYPNSDVHEVKVKKGYDYVFFDKKKGNEFGEPDEMELTLNDGREEYNKIYVLFSPSPFTQPVMKNNGTLLPPSLSREEFSKWMIKTRRNDESMSVKSMNILISPR